METREALQQRVRHERAQKDMLQRAAVRLEDAQTERLWAMVSAQRAGLSIRQIAAASGLSSSRIHQLLSTTETAQIPQWLNPLRETDSQSVAAGEPLAALQTRLASEVTLLRRCIGWLKDLERGEPVAVNLRLDTDLQTEFAAFDRPRVMKVIERIAAELDELARQGLEPLYVDLPTMGDADALRVRHRRQLAEPSTPPLTSREQWAALRGPFAKPRK